MRQIVLDTETTGLEVRQGHRLIEIACVEMIERRPTGRYYQTYLNPDRAIDEGAIEVHPVVKRAVARASTKRSHIQHWYQDDSAKHLGGIDVAHQVPDRHRK